MSHIKVGIPYIGGELSKNRSHTRAGYLKPEPRKWCEVLAMLIRTTMSEQDIGTYSLEPPLDITISGAFRGKPPDIHNLFPLIADCIQDVVGINDQHFRMHTGRVGKGEPMVFVEITDAKERAMNEFYDTYQQAGKEEDGAPI